ncbi:protein artemis isoform X2 [Ahaetulla prasina]|uniref:protein artemis isoform X2 n=1 Tax=Ahaetulla prasina TaxID=499056 RepID=UPI0026473D9D|nr:protein artemis isoform X2 [Ahaetulla prasina]
MSSFGGVMREYPHLSIDRFDRENLRARAYFLSHCHKDHMKGLRAPSMKRRLACSLKLLLYCSPVTKELLLSSPRYTFWENYIVTLEVETPTQISLIEETSGEKEDIEVTLLPAGHCPGSVMFLFQGENGTVLYTGDFRLARGEVARMELLHSGSRVKDIQSVYLDTTFFDRKYYQIPSREECMKGLMELVRSWVAQSPYHVVWLNCKAAYGYEYLFTNLSEELGIKIQDFLSYICPVNVYPNVIPLGSTQGRLEENLKPFCRKYRPNNQPAYKPLGLLKRPRALELLDTNGGSDDDDLFDAGLIPTNSKVPKRLPGIGPGESKPLPPNHEEDHSRKASPVPTSLQVDFVECEESNGEEEEEEEEEEEQHEKETALPGSPVPGTDFIEALQHPDNRVGSTSPGKQREDQPQANSEVPKWESFFRRPSEDPETSDHEGHLPCTGSTEPPSPGPSNDEDLSDSTHISSQDSSQSTHISEQGSQGWDSQADTVLISSQERRHFREFSPSKGRPERTATCLPHLPPGETKMDSPNSWQAFDRGASSAKHVPLEGGGRCWGAGAAPNQTEPGEESTKAEGRPEVQTVDSQSSSDFEVPPTPGAESPKPQQLCSLYQKLAAGENLH